MAELLSDSEITSELAALDGWDRNGDKIEKNYELKDFVAALKFINNIGDKAEAMNHHPELLLHDWNQVKVMLTTYSQKGITNNDTKLAGDIESISR